MIGLLLAPFRGLLALAQEIGEEVRQECVDDENRIVQELRASYQALECGSISEQEFEEREKPLLDRLELLQASEIGRHDP